jgi:glyoxylase-like metal-dependent hydrolase (beta-lactamase superfamily II)
MSKATRWDERSSVDQLAVARNPHRMTRRSAHLLLSVLASAVVATACAGSTTPAAPPSPPAADEAVGRFASDNPGSVNTYWMSVPDGLLVIDTGRNVSGGHRAAAAIRQTGKPVVAILITHPHPDHVGGAGALREEFPDVPMYASEATAAWMRADPLGFYPLARQADPDFPAQLTYPDRTFPADQVLDIGGVQLHTAQFGPGESETATAYYEPASRILFSGDLTGEHVTPALLEGRSCGWLTNLERLAQRFPDALTAYPGHGSSDESASQIAEQDAYLRTFRGLVRPATLAESAAGADVAPDELRSIVAELDRQYPDFPLVASLPNLQELNIAAVAGELRAEDPLSTPLVCR